MEKNADVLIVGGGLNGPALALALAQAGLRVALIDARPEEARTEQGFDGRAYALALASVRVLRAIGVWDQIAACQPILGIQTAHGHAGNGASPLMLGFDHAEIEEGTMGQMVEDRHLYAAFLAAMREVPAILRLPGRRVVAQSVAPGQAEVTLDDGMVLRARVMVGCDGRDSATAARAGISRWGHDYGQDALVCAVEHERPHGGTAHQIFLPGGPFAILPLPGKRSSIVWSERRALASQIAALDDAAFLEALRPRFGSFLGAISLAGARFSYPLRLTVASVFVAQRLALVGDAAHGVHPIAGQGLNLGLRDVAALSEVLIMAARRGEDIGALDVLERYQRWRRFDVVRMALGMDAVNGLFSNESAVLGALRGLGLGLVNAMPALRRRFIREAAGITAAEPRLMQGLPI